MTLAVFRDYNLAWKVEGYEELSFTTEDDAIQAAELATHYYIDRHSREMQQESRFGRAASRTLTCGDNTMHTGQNTGGQAETACKSAIDRHGRAAKAAEVAA